MNNKIISCAIHDHFEIACMRASKINLVLHDGQCFNGVAKDLETKNKLEFLHLETNKEIVKIDLLTIKTLQFNGDDTIITVSSDACSL